MAGMDQLREEIMSNHAKLYRSIMRMQDDIVIQGALSEDIDERMISLNAQVETIRDNVASLNIKINEMAEINKDTNDRIKVLEDLIRTLVQTR